MRSLIVMAMVALLAAPAMAADNCNFVDNGGGQYVLTASCSTDATIVLSDLPGITSFSNQGNNITAVKPLSGAFIGPVVLVQNAAVDIRGLSIIGADGGLGSFCMGGANRLAGLKYDAASGNLRDVTVTNVRRDLGALGCQEGSAVWIQNFTDNQRRNLTLQNVTVRRPMKGGIVSNGIVRTIIQHSSVESADLALKTAANSVQFGFGASGVISHSDIGGNQWDGNGLWTATGVLVYLAGDVNITNNTITGVGTDVGIDAEESGTVNIMNNVISRSGPDGPFDWGYGVYFYGNSGKSKVVNNDLSGWVFPITGADVNHANAVEP